MLNRNTPLCIDDMTEDELIEELKKSEKEFEDGKYWDEEEFYREEKAFLRDDNVVSNINNIIDELIQYSKQCKERICIGGFVHIVAGHMEKTFNCSPSWTYNLKFHTINLADKNDEKLKELYHKILEDFYRDNILHLEDNLFILYKNVSKVVVTLCIGEMDTEQPLSTAKTVTYETLSGLSYAIDYVEKQQKSIPKKNFITNN